MAEKPLTTEIAEQFLADDESVDLSEFTVLDDEAAEILSRHKGDLYLDSLTSLSDAAAESLSKYKGYLSLDGLMSLSDAAAESLCRLELGCLSLELDHFMTSSGYILQSHLTWDINRDD